MKHLTKNLANWSRDERGNVAMAFAMMLVPMTMFVGGAVDFGVAMREQTKLQVAADAAALAGAAGTDVPEQTRQSNANKTFAANFDSTVISNIAPTVSINSAAVTVHAAAPVATKFLSLLHLNELDIEVTSVAKKQSSQTTTTSGGSKICLLALDPQSTDGIHIQGTNDVNYTNCWGYTNSSQATAINAVGTAIATGEGHCAAGGYTGGTQFSPAPTSGCPVVPDPFASVGAYEPLASYQPNFTPPPLPITCKAQNLSLMKGTYTLEPGRYCGGIDLKAQANVTLKPGLYIIDNGHLNVQSGSSISGSNVVFYFSGANARMTIIGGGTVNLKGRNSGWSYEGMLFIAHPDAWRGLASNIQGGGTFNLEGMLYMPTQRIEVSGNGNVNASSPYFAMVAKDFYFRGNGQFNLGKHKSGSTLADKVPNKPTVTVGATYVAQ